MSSPFPGMDPFIEGCGCLWGDFHHHLIEEIGKQIADSAPRRYLVRTDLREYLELIEEPENPKRKPFIPDVKITESQRPKRLPGGNGVAVAERDTETDTGESQLLRAYSEEENREAFIEIYDIGSKERLVTCIEILSPANKLRSSTGQEVYCRKRKGLILGEVNFVEIDLLRGGERMPMVDPWPRSPYALLVSRAASWGNCRVWPAYALKPLPIIPVPLLKPDADLSIQLQPMIETIYRRFRYEQTIDYRKPINPPLAADETAWLKKQLRNRKEKA